MAVSKTFYTQNNIGTAKYVVSYHNGVKKHRDGSPFFDIAIFRSKKKLRDFVKGLTDAGYKERQAYR
jgi:hypothetical protein